VGGLVDAGRAGEAVRQIAADLDGLRTGDAGFAADFVRARRAALVRALGDPVRSSIAADRLEAVLFYREQIKKGERARRGCAEGLGLRDAEAGRCR